MIISYCLYVKANAVETSITMCTHGGSIVSEQQKGRKSLISYKNVLTKQGN